MPSIYVHVPFCVRKCAYCAFYSVPLKSSEIHKGVETGQGNASMVRNYLQGLKKEIELRQKDAPQGVSSLFIGGGTPTALSEEELETLLSLLKQGFDLAETAEQTIEGNPGTLTREKLQLLRRAGINRISLGVQSFNDTLLRRIGRIHTVRDVHEGVRLIREAGFANLNLDLMFGLPGQTLEDWQDTLQEAVRLAPEHLSVYGLMVEEETPLSSNDKLLALLPDDDCQAEMYAWTRAYLKEAGYRHYETSNFARPGFECQHNLNYWLGEDYLGLGPGAVGCIRNIRSKNYEDIANYLNKLNQNCLPLTPEDYEVLTEKERMAERMILGLRLAQGVNLADFQKEFGHDLRDIYRPVLERYRQTNVFNLDETTLKLNPDIWFIANQVLQEFV